MASIYSVAIPRSQPPASCSVSGLIATVYSILDIKVINNLRIEHIEVRSEDDPDIAPYVHEKQIEFIKCEKGAETVLQTVKKVACTNTVVSTFSCGHSILFSCLLHYLL